MQQDSNGTEYLRNIEGYMNAAHVPMGYKSLLSDDARQAAQALRLALEPFVKLSPTIPASYIISFCMVAEKEGRPVSEYANEIGVYKAVMTRHLLDLGERDRHGGEGMGILDQKRDRKDLRVNRTFVNEKGAAILSRVRLALQLGRGK